MLVVMKKDSTPEDLERVVRLIEQLGYRAHPIPGAERTAVGITGNSGPLDPTLFEVLPGVAQALPVTQPYKLVSREVKPEATRIRVGPVQVGGGAFTVIAGPCAVESEAQILDIAHQIKAAGGHMLRGGAFKPRTSPYSFQGLGEQALRWLARAREETGLPVVTEAVDEASLKLVEEYADVIQIGARNMQNFALLKAAGRSARPVLLKRGMWASLEDFLMSAEYLLSEGNYNVILCERGIRTFSQHSRFTLDLSVVPVVQKKSHLPILVDPSHATGVRDRVAPMARAALAAGADGVMVEVHPNPDRALSDGAQALLPTQLEQLMAELQALGTVLRRPLEPAT